MRVKHTCAKCGNETTFRQKRIYWKENNRFVGIGWYCENCKKFTWDTPG